MDIQQLRHKHKSALVQHAFKITGHHKDFPAAEKFESEWVDYLLHGGEINQMLLALRNAKPVDFTPPDPNNFDLSSCSISILEDSLPSIWHAGEIYSIKINIFNSTNYFWQTSGKTPIYLCYHWYKNDGEVCVFDGLRTNLSSIVHINKNNCLSLRVQSPKEQGQYFLAVTLVWEGQFWFEDKGLNLKNKEINIDAAKNLLNIKTFASDPPNTLMPYAGKKVAVLAPASIDSVEGGAERFYSGLSKALSKFGCIVDFISLKVDESSFEKIQKGYQDFSSLNLSDYDLVISTKAPSYAVNHPNHVLYLVHTVRVFYDMYEDAFKLPNEDIKKQRAWIHEQDNKAFANIPFRYSIGKTVSERMERWNNCTAEVIHPPLDIDGLYTSSIGDYFYMPGRLHQWKRVDLAIKAIKASSLPMRLLISGSGDAELELKILANNDQRIKFLGRVDDESLRKLYAESLAVTFMPIREDYGYVTVEAFSSEKAVITCVDSGEPTEIIEHEKSGLICDPNPESVRNAMEKLWLDRDLASYMGKNGKKKIEDISWRNVASKLLSAGFPNIKEGKLTKNRMKVAILDMQPIMPAVGGGRIRLLGLYHSMGTDIEARYVGTYDWPGEKIRRQLITPTLEEVLIPLSDEHHIAAKKSATQAGGKTVIDMLFSEQAHLSKEYIEETINATHWADVVIFSHPWVAPLISKELLKNKTVIYDSHNVEKLLREQLLDVNSDFERYVLNKVIEAEKLAGDEADLILACSEEDVDGFVEHYNFPRSKIKVFANGVFADKILPATKKQKKEARLKLNIKFSEKICFFIGSNYQPNVDAANFILNNLAAEFENIIFIIGGGVCDKLSKNLPSNVRAIGYIEEDEKLLWLHASDFGLNPMFSGSGTNIKMFDFMSAGLPVVTTKIGARGIATKSTPGLYLCDKEEFHQVLGDALRKDEVISDGLLNREKVLKGFSWESISPLLGREVRSVHLKKTGKMDIIKSHDSKIKVIHFSTLGLKCGIGEYTKKIIDIYRRKKIENFVFTAKSANQDPVIENIEYPVNVGWYFDNVDWVNSEIYQESIDFILNSDAKHLIIQYHPGFFSSDLLKNFIKKISNKNILISVVVHNYQKSCSSSFSEIKSLGVNLFSHRTTEVMEAVKDGVFLDKIPLPIDSENLFQKKSISGRDLIHNPPVIATTGFLRKHKGVKTLISSMPLILKKYPGAKLIIQCALYPSPDSQQELEDCKSEIKKLKLEESIVMDNRFLDKEEVLRSIFNADIAILPYEQSNEGGSATAADCIGLGLPVIVSNAEIFDEIRDVVYTVEPTSECIFKAVDDIFSNPLSYAKLAAQSYSYAKENSWDNISGVFLVN